MNSTTYITEITTQKNEKYLSEGRNPLVCLPVHLPIFFFFIFSYARRMLYSEETTVFCWLRMEVQTYSNVNIKSQAGNTWDKDITTIRPKPKENQLGILKMYAFCQKIQQKTLGPGECCWCYVFFYENAPKKLLHLPPKSCRNFT